MEYSEHAVGVEDPAPGLRSDSGEKAGQKQEWLEEKSIQVICEYPI